MPRVVDHEQRRSDLVDAAWQLIVADGLAGVTIRRLAERSGWSSGAVRHYLPTRDAILDAAARRVGEVIEQRLRAVDTFVEPLQAITDLLTAVLPSDDLSRTASLVWLAFVGQAATDRPIADAQGILYADLHTALVDRMHWLIDNGFEVPDGAASTAAQLQGLVDGLTVHVLLERITLAHAHALLAAAVRRVVVRPG